MLYIDSKYINMLGPRLRNFKKKNDYVWNFSCPFCNDSAKNSLRARGYIYRKKNDLFFRCHNCGYGTNLGNLLKKVDQSIYDQYVIERYKEGATRYNSHKDVSQFIADTKTPEPKPLTDSILDGLKCIADMDEDHPAVHYIHSRQIPKDKWKLLYYTPKFKKFTNTITPKFIEPIEGEHPRLIIPYLDKHGKCFAFQGRAFGDEQPKYYTIKIDEEREKIYGIDRLDYSKKIFVVEGPIDSLFLPNAIAVSGASFDTPFVRSILTNATLVIDNEPRNKEIVKLVGKYIDIGYSVTLLPEEIKQKDINEMILAGMSSNEIVQMLNKFTFSGLEAKLRFNEWKKI